MELILTPSLTQLMPVGDGDRLLFLVTSHMDEHKHPTCAYMHTSHTTPNTQKILSLLYQIKYNIYYNKNSDIPQLREEITEEYSDLLGPLRSYLHFMKYHMKYL